MFREIDIEMRFKTLLLIMLLSGSLIGLEADDGDLPREIVLSWTGDTRTTQAISWTQPDIYAVGEIKYIKASEYAGSFNKANGVKASKTYLGDGLARFEGELTDLLPNTEYMYSVGAGKAFSKGVSFKTADNTNTFSFAFMGDAQASPDEGSYTDWGKLLKDALSEDNNNAFILMAGDLINDGKDVSEWRKFFAASGGLFAQIPVMSTIGNHDAGGLLTKYFIFPENGPAGVKEQFYSFDYGNAHFTILDSNLMGLYNQNYADWLKNDLAGTNKLWKIIMFHHPIYPAMDNPKEVDRAQIIQSIWLPIFEDNEVDLVLYGHQHVYMRTHPLRGGKKDDTGQGIVYLMGVSGEKGYTSGEFTYIDKAVEKTSCYTLFQIEGNVLTLTTKDGEGDIIDWARILH